MPLELGFDLGCKRYGSGKLRQKVLLILDVERYRYQQFISDIAGQDIGAHRGEVARVISLVRDWLRLELDPRRVKTPSGLAIRRRYETFQRVLPAICADLNWDINELPFSDFSWAVYDWIRNNPID